MVSFLEVNLESGVRKTPSLRHGNEVRRSRGGTAEKVSQQGRGENGS